MYRPDDSIWDIFGIARPATVVPDEPIAPSMTISCGGEYDCANPFYQRDYDAWLPKHQQWKAIRDAALPQYQALNAADLRR